MRRNRLCFTGGLVMVLVTFVVVINNADTDNSEIPLPNTSDSLPALPVPGTRNIFFLETSCVLEEKPASNYTYNSGLVLPPRAACALESAAVAHPDRPVYYVHTCPVDEENLLHGAPDYVQAVFSLPNVFLWSVRFSTLFFGSRLGTLMKSGALRKSKWPESHGSDILRYFLLWKYGGTYFDTDVLVLRSFNDLRDFTCAESPKTVSAGAMDFSWEEPGRLLAETCLNETLMFNGVSWGHNGPGVITRAMKSVCGVKNISEMNTTRCNGFSLLPTSDIYPVSYPRWKWIFLNKHAANAMKTIKSSYAIHVWNTLSRGTPVNTSSQAAYAQIARRVCPQVISSVKEYI